MLEIVYDEIKHSHKGKENQSWTTPTECNKRVQRSVEGTKKLFPKECRISIYSGAIKIKYKNLFSRLLNLQTSADAIVRFTNMKEDGDMLEIEPHGKLLERKFMIHDKCYRDIRANQRMK